MTEQLDRVIDILVDLSKGFYLSGFAIPSFLDVDSLIVFARAFMLGSVCLIASLKLIELKEELV